MASVDQDGDVVDVLLQTKRDRKAEKCFFKCILKRYDNDLRRIAKDKLSSYRVAYSELAFDVMHPPNSYSNNRAEQSHRATRVRRQEVRKFKTIK